MNQRINVTETFLPPQEEYQKYLDKIWSSHHLTNQGPLLLEFEKKARAYLGVKDFHFVTNGTVALQISLGALNITDGEIITTPFTYVATTSTILWERCTPVFVDIDPETLNIDASKIEAAITKKTKAIMAVHVFGNPCDVEAIGNIAKKHKLKVIYDGAHAFGVRHNGRSLLSYGDISTCSFHATKLFHTIEGGCVIAKDKAVSNRLELIKRFGHHGDDHFMLGINAKASEFQAAMGLCNLKYVDEIIAERKTISDKYTKLLGDKVRLPRLADNTQYNYIYYPVIFKTQKRLLETVKQLNDENIFPRRYFYPSLNELPYLESIQSCPISEDISKRILCLPLYSGMKNGDINRICKVVTG